MAVREITNLETGFSLIELMISLTILGIVLAGIVAMFTSTSRHHTGQEMMVEVVQNVRSTRNLMADEIRSAGCNPKEIGRMGFETDSSDDRFNTDANSIHFSRDIDNDDGDSFYESDGDPDDPNEDIAYYRTQDTCEGTVGTILAAGNNTPGCLRRNTGGGGQPVMERVTDLQFQYYDNADQPFYQENGDGTLVIPLTLNSGYSLSNSGLDRIKSVRVTITAQVQNPNRVSAGNRTWTQQFQILVRNSF